MDGLRDAVVLVTGGSGGVGRALAIEAARRGASRVIIGFASDRHGAQATAAGVRDLGAEAIIVQGDVSDDADCRTMAAAAEQFGRLDVLFNNAGFTTFAAHDDLDAVGPNDFGRIFAVNVTGAFQMARACRALLERPELGGAVVNVASIAGVTGVGSSVPYAASKGALITMTLSLARALAPRIRVNAVCPGFVDTPWFSKGGDGRRLAALRAQVSATTPLRAASTPDDIAPAAIFLASRDAHHVTGETLLVDAGLHLGAAPPAKNDL